MAAVALLEILRRERTFALAAVIASLGFALSLGIMNVDGFIVRQNVDRAVQGEEFDVSYLADLSADAVPALAAAYQTQPLPAPVKEGVGAALACYAAELKRDRAPLPWQSFHLSRVNAARNLKSLEADLETYQMHDSDWDFKVTAPSGEEYGCYTFWD